MTKQVALYLIIGLLLNVTGCGSQPSEMSTKSSIPSFENQTQVSDAVLQCEWQQAQTALAANPIYIDAASSDPPKYLPADPRADSVEPHGVVVTGVPDASWSSLPSDI